MTQEVDKFESGSPFLKKRGPTKIIVRADMPLPRRDSAIFRTSFQRACLALLLLGGGAAPA